MTTLCLTGWQQAADALTGIAPADAVHADYSHSKNVNAFLATLPPRVDTAIGWSLGGQLLVRAIAGGYVQAKQVILLGAPFQFLATPAYKEAMPEEMFTGVLSSYKADPAAMAAQFAGIISAGDVHAMRIARALSQRAEVWPEGVFWLEELGRFSCAPLDFSAFPSTVIVHGDEDKVIYPAQAGWFQDRLPQATLHRLKGCGHAPHLHDAAFIRRLVEGHV